MARDKYKFELPRDIERYLARLSKLYSREDERELQRIIVNAQTRVVEEWHYDNWNGGTYIHALYLIIPDALYLPIARRRDDIGSRIAKDLNEIHNVENESIGKVFIEADDAENGNWRQESGALLQPIRLVSDEAANRIWRPDQFRLFLSHKSEVKRETAKLKEDLECYGVSCFVAHEDIHPTKEWQDEIENALATMDGFVALMTEKFHESNWTDQEVGYAFARSVPIIAARLGRDPYGFIGKFQGLSCTWDTAPEAIVKLLIAHDKMFAGYVSALKKCSSFDRGNVLSQMLPAIEKLSEEQADMIVEAYNSNLQVRGSFGFNGEKPFVHGPGLQKHLERWTGHEYLKNTDGTLFWF